MVKPPPKKPPKELLETMVIPDAAKQQGASKPVPVEAAKGVDVKAPPMWNMEDKPAPPGGKTARKEALAALTQTTRMPEAPTKPEGSNGATPQGDEATPSEQDAQDALLMMETSAAYDELQQEIEALKELVSRLPE